MGESVLRDRGVPFGSGHLLPRLSKGKQVKIPAPRCGYFCGNATELEDACAGPGKSYLFFLTASYKQSPFVSAFGAGGQGHRGSGLPGDTVDGLAEHHKLLWCPVRSRRPLKTPGRE